MTGCPPPKYPVMTGRSGMPVSQHPGMSGMAVSKYPSTPDTLGTPFEKAARGRVHLLRYPLYRLQEGLYRVILLFNTRNKSNHCLPSCLDMRSCDLQWVGHLASCLVSWAESRLAQAPLYSRGEKETRTVRRVYSTFSTVDCQSHMLPGNLAFLIERQILVFQTLPEQV